MIIDLIVSPQTSLEKPASNRLNQTQERLKGWKVFYPGPPCTNWSRTLRENA